MRATREAAGYAESVMEGVNGDQAAWLRCYRCWSQRLEAQVHYDAILKVDPVVGRSRRPRRGDLRRPSCSAWPACTTSRT